MNQNNHKWAIILATVALLLAYTTTVTADLGVTITRDLPDSVNAGETMNVTLFVDVDENELPSAVQIRENVPTGWEIISAYPNYGSNPSAGEYNWLLSPTANPVQDTTITYTISVPNETVNNATFSGIVRTTSGDVAIAGDTNIIVNGSTLVIGVSASRNLPSIVTPGSSAEVILTIDVNETEAPNAVIITENIPSGWSINSSSPAYNSNPSSGEYKWLFYGTDVIDTIINYTVSVPGTASGTATFSGTAGTSSFTIDIEGDTEVSIAIIPGDTNGDGDVDDMELLIYIDDWSQGSVSDLDLLQAIEYWTT